MREILFRGKRLDNGEWVTGAPFIAADCCKMICAVAVHPDFVDEGNVYYSEGFPVNPGTVGQYTDLQDKNGTRIFEGDICRNTRTGEIVSVKWHGTMAGYVWSKPRKDNKYLYDFGELFRVYDKYEVIGNIHDNPELLGGEGDGN